MSDLSETYFPNLDGIIRGILFLYCFSLPFEKLVFLERSGFIILVVLIVLWCVVNRRLFFSRTPLDIPLLALVVCIAISLPFSASVSYSSQEFAKLIQQVLIFYVIVEFFRHDKHRLRLAALLLGELGFVSLYGIVQYDATPKLISSVLSGEVWLTTYLVTLVPLGAAFAMLAIMDKRPIQVVTGVGISFLALLCQVLTFSRAGIVAMLCEAVAFACVARRKSLVKWVVGLVFTVILFNGILVGINAIHPVQFMPSNSKLSLWNIKSRIMVWQLGLEQLWEHPLVGIGFGKSNFYHVAQADVSPAPSDDGGPPMATGLHNTFLDFAVGAGIPAGLAYLWVMAEAMRTGFRRAQSMKESALAIWPMMLMVMVVGVFVRNMFDHMWIGTMAIQFWVLVGLSISVPSEQNELPPKFRLPRVTYNRRHHERGDDEDTEAAIHLRV
ncbi:MAG: O-antigen ligase family protein [Nitrospiraceae bacterium]